MLTTPFSMSSASPLSNGSAIYKRFLGDYNIKTESHKISEIRLLLTGLLTLRFEDTTTKQRSKAEGVEKDLGRLWKRL